MWKKSYLRKAVLLAIFAGMLTSARAQFDEGWLTVQSFQPVMSGNAIAVDSNRTVTYSGAGEDSVHLLNVVSLRILEDQNIYFASGFTATVIFSLKSWENLEDDPEPVEKSLTVNLDTAGGAVYNALAYFLVPDALKIEITITGVTITGASGWDPRTVLKLDNEMRARAYFTFSDDAQALTPDFQNHVNKTDALHVSWTVDPSSRSNMSQLEWAWVADEMADYYKESNVINYTKLFADNSSRVDIDPDKNCYDIPLLYDGAGKLYYRVREAYRKNSGALITGPWSDAESFSFTGHFTNLNWVRETQFAEDGKNKTVIQYFDGTMKSRQTVTKDNATGNTVVAETLYDFQGRPNIQILPTPTADQTIQYFTDFNRFSGQPAGENPARYFDLTPGAFKCAAPPQLDITKGNGRYYSSNNDWIGTEKKSDYIPDANGYAYSETRYTDDATQRVKKQGGVGENHQIGSGHETNFFYGKPSQPELDALFGTDAGYAAHYFKNMVQDANGQMSVSYVDMHGRTVATALAGEAPQGMDAIHTDHTLYPVAGTLTQDLLTPESNIISGNVITSVSTLLAPAPTDYNFTYQLDPGILKLFDCNSNAICYDCKYDLEITIRPENCGPEQTVIRKYSNLQLVEQGDPCVESMGFTGEGITTPTTEITFNETLGAGSWVVTKTLTVNDSIFQLRRQTALEALLCRTETYLYDSVLNVLKQETGCAAPDLVAAGCDSCMAHLGTFSQYRTAYLQSLGAAPSESGYDQQIHRQYSVDSIVCAQSCGALSTEFSTLGNLRRRMLSDMIPFTGQYAQDTVLPANSATSRFNVMITRSGHAETPYFRHPADESGNHDYFTDEGTIDQNIEPGNDRHIILDTISKNRFANLFQYSWTSSLIQYHPEYTKLRIAETTLATSYLWMDSVLACDSYTKAHSKGYDAPLTHDPYFTNNYIPADYTTMQRYITVNAGPAADTTHFSLWRIANGMIMCGSRPDQEKTGCMYSQSASGISTSATIAQKDAIWQQFRSMYLSFRNDMVLAYINGRPDVISRQTMDSLIGEKKQLAFATTTDFAAQNGWSEWWDILTDESHDTTGLYDAASGYADSLLPNACESQRPLWKAELMQCGALQQLLENETSGDSIQVENILSAILDSMVMVCQHSKDAQHPSGASDVNPAYVGTPRTFEGIVNHVFDQYGIATTADTNYFCNPFSITYPKPYNGMQPPLSVKYSNTIDSCGCSRFAALKSEADALSYDTTSFFSMNLFLNTEYHDSLTLPLWTALLRCADEMGKDTCTQTPGQPGYPVYFRTMSQQSLMLPPVGDCPVVHIQSILHYLGAPVVTTETVQVNYYTIDATFCYLRVYDAATGLLEKQVQVTTGLSQSVDVTLPSCKGYNFRLYGTNDNCFDTPSNQVSDSTKCASSCPEPVLDSVIMIDTGSVNNIRIRYSATGTSSLKVTFTDVDTDQDYTWNLDANASADTFSLPGCHRYFVQLMSGSWIHDPCRDTSQVFYLEGCGTDCERTTEIAIDTFVVIPPFLSCGYRKPCLTCGRLDSLVTEFRQIFSEMNAAPYTDSVVTDKEAAQNLLLTRFLNYRTGLSATVGDYLDAYRSCHSVNPPTGAALCLFDKPLNDPSGFFEPDTTPCRSAQTQATFIAHQLYLLARDSVIAGFDQLYKAKCLEAKYTERFYVQYQPVEYHYTLYYYDQAGNLVATLPPSAVKPNYSQAFLDSVASAREAGTYKGNYKNNDALATQYRYNTLNQVVIQKSPDGGTSHFWYDHVGRLAVSQNAKQEADGGLYIYTIYDALGRITEVGQAGQSTSMTQAISQDATSLHNWLAASTKEQVTGTVYDEAYTPLETAMNGFSGLYQQNLRSRVSYTFVKQLETTTLWDAATFYSYDIQGNVDTLVQDYKTGTMAGAGNRFKKIVYDYDQISGKVNRVSYQPGFPDAFYHRYEYDPENRITEVFTSKDKIFWERDAAYYYYRHGPLARTVLGQNQVQGVDYAYTIQGWLKGINSLAALPNSNACEEGTAPDDMVVYDRSQNGSPAVYTARNSITFEPGFESSSNDAFEASINGSAGNCDIISETLTAKDMGEDGTLTARDAYGLTLHYYDAGSVHDYVPIGATQPLTGIMPAGFDFASLYNGNIGAMSVNVPQLGIPLLYSYRYDQLNRLKTMQAYKGLNAQTNSWEPVSMEDYKESITYDPNGNIVSYLRNGDATRLSMDNLTYSYKPNTNQLDKVTDAATDAAAGEYDKYRDIKKGQANGNYGYDEIGNLVKDDSAGISLITWNVYGKIKTISKTDGSSVAYTYDASGNRISKTVTPASGPATATWYVRDASGNVMSIYSKDAALNSGDLTQSEVHLYGSNRLGIYNLSINVEDPAPVGIITFARGRKFFELTNHLGNVLATVSDKKLQHSTDGITVDYYRADVISANDYYPFGMGMPGRKYATANTDYRYGFNGKELDKETSATTTYDYGFRIYSPGLGRFLSVDPIAANYPNLSTYQFAGNTPIWALDLDGLEPLAFQEWKGGWSSIEDFKLIKGSKSHVRVVNFGEIYEEGKNYIAIRDQKEKGKWWYATYENQVGSLGNSQKGNFRLYNPDDDKYEAWTPEGFVPADQEIRTRAAQVGGFGRAEENLVVQAVIFGVTAPLGGAGSWGSRLLLNGAKEVAVNGRNADVADITMSSLPGMGGAAGVAGNSLFDWTPGAQKQINQRVSSIFLPNSRYTSHKSLQATLTDAGTGYIFEGMKLFSNKSIPGLSKPQQNFLNSTYDMSEKVINKTMKEGIEDQK